MAAREGAGGGVGVPTGRPVSRRDFLRTALISGALLAVGCDAPGSQHGGAPVIDGLPLQVVEGAFSIYGVAKDARAIADINEALAAEGVRVRTDLAHPGEFPVTVLVYPDQAGFDRAVPTMAGFFACSGARRIQMVSPRSAGLHVSLTYADGVLIAVHEYVHLVLNEIDPSMPIWLNEGTACYIGPHELYSRACRSHFPWTLVPTFHCLRDDYHAVEAADLFAYAAVDFVAAEHGRDGLNMLLRGSGSVEEALGMSEAEFDDRWQSYMRQHYGPAQVPGR